MQATTNILLPFESESFDIVTSIGVLEHVREFGGSEEESLKEIKRVLIPGGRFFCFHLPNRYSWIEHLSKIVGKWHHEYRFTRSEIDYLCRVVDIELMECKKYGFLPRNVLGRWPLSKLLRVKQSDNLFEDLDDMLEKLLSVASQNWFFCAKKRYE